MHGKNIMIADSPAEFAESIIKILNDQSLRHKITKNARELIDEHYTWDKCSKKYEQLYEYLLENR